MYPFKDEIAELKKKCLYGRNPFHLASRNGQAGIAETIMKNSAKLNIDLNVKDNDGWTAFHCACFWGKTSIVELMLSNSEYNKLDLTATDHWGRTGFQLAKQMAKTDVMNLIKSKMPNIA